MSNPDNLRVGRAYAANKRRRSVKARLRDRFGPEVTEAIVLVSVLFVASRVVLIIIGVVSRLLIKPLLQQPLTTYTPALILDLWGVWDTRWYLDLAQNGYSTRVIGPNGETNTVFFPLYPLLMRLLGAVLRSDYVAGLIISNLALLLAGVMLYRLVRLDRDHDAALSSIKYLILFPTAFIFSGIFSESLFFLLLISCFYFARTQRWVWAGVTGFFLALTRPIGVFVIIPLLWEYFRASKWRLQTIRADVLALLLIPWGIVVFGFYLSQTTGSFFDFVQATAWRREAGNPLMVLVRGLGAPNVHLVFGATVALVSLGLVLAFARRIGPSFLVLGLYSILIPLSTGLISLRSMPRYALTVLPLYVILSDVGDRDKRIDQALTISLGLLQGFLMTFWTNRSLLVV